MMLPPKVEIMKNTTKKQNGKSVKKTAKKIVHIDITDIYEKLKKKSEDEIRSIEEQCKFFIKEGLDLITDRSITHITYTQQPRYDDDGWNRPITTPSYPSPWTTNYPWVCCDAKTTRNAASNLDIDTVTIDENCLKSVDVGVDSNAKTNGCGSSTLNIC